MAARLEVRLDDERKQRLEELGEAEGVPISEVVRRLIDDAWEEVMRARRIAAVERMAQLEIEDVPDPDTLSRELEETYEPGGLS
ncbi:MAG: ribbon-helix-helix protein, CopG family [Chloroflexi bacterium]|nr:ribbon-helix-helix protein, CopG family [Chloroflexota bacterium]